MKHAVVKASSPWWAKAMVVTGSMVMVVSGGGAIAAQIGVTVLEDSVNQADLLGDQRVESEGEKITGPLNFLVLGTDERVGAGGEARTDADIIVHVNEDLTQVSMISLPRDLYVEIPSGVPASETKLTEAFAYSEDWGESFQNTAETITHLTGIQFDGGAIANFEGFLDMVDELGTIELCPWHDITSIHGDKKTYEEGCAEYNKEDALDLVRQRYGWDSDEDYANGTWGDFGRQKMQQQAIKKILERAKEMGYATDPTKAVDLLNSFGDALTLDVGAYSLIDMITQMRDVDPNEIISIGTPSSEGNINGTSFVLIHEGTDEEVAADALWEAIANDTINEWACENDQWLSGDSKPDCAVAPVDGGQAAGEEATSDEPTVN